MSFGLVMYVTLLSCVLVLTWLCRDLRLVMECLG